MQDFQRCSLPANLKLDGSNQQRHLVTAWNYRSAFQTRGNMAEVLGRSSKINIAAGDLLLFAFDLHFDAIPLCPPCNGLSSDQYAVLRDGGENR
jgi:hypothetical protein